MSNRSNKFCFKKKNLIFFDAIAIEPVYTVFELKNVNIEEINKNHATTQFYDFSDATNKTNYYFSS